MPIGHAVRGLSGCGMYTDMLLEEKRFRAGGFLFFRRLGISPQVIVFISYAARHRTFRYGFADVFSHRV